MSSIIAIRSHHAVGCMEEAEQAYPISLRKVIVFVVLENGGIDGLGGVASSWELTCCCC